MIDEKYDVIGATHVQKSGTPNFARLTFRLFRNGFYCDSRAHNSWSVKVAPSLILEHLAVKNFPL